MATPMTGEIKMFAFNFAPKDYAKCDGQVLPITQNQALYALVGTAFGGDGRTTFQLPDLRGRTVIGPGNYIDGIHTHVYNVGQGGGQETVTLDASAMPPHTHQLYGKASPTSPSPQPNDNEVLCDNDNSVYSQATSGLVNLSPGTCSSVGSGLAHQNMQPYQVINFCMALEGIFPSRN